jgi:hypothetical protein
MVAKRDRTCGTRAVVLSIHRTTVCGLVLDLVPGIVRGTSRPHVRRTCGREVNSRVRPHVWRHPEVSLVCDELLVDQYCPGTRSCQERWEGYSCNCCMIVLCQGGTGLWCPFPEVKTVFPVDTFFFSENKKFLSRWQGRGRKEGKSVKTTFFEKKIVVRVVRTMNSRHNCTVIPR